MFAKSLGLVNLTKWERHAPLSFKTYKRCHDIGSYKIAKSSIRLLASGQKSRRSCWANILYVSLNLKPRLNACIVMLKGATRSRSVPRNLSAPCQKVSMSCWANILYVVPGPFGKCVTLTPCAGAKLVSLLNSLALSLIKYFKRMRYDCTVKLCDILALHFFQICKTMPEWFIHNSQRLSKIFIWRRRKNDFEISHETSTWLWETSYHIFTSQCTIKSHKIEPWHVISNNVELWQA